MQRNLVGSNVIEGHFPRNDHLHAQHAGQARHLGQSDISQNGRRIQFPQGALIAPHLDNDGARFQRIKRAAAGAGRRQKPNRAAELAGFATGGEQGLIRLHRKPDQAGQNEGENFQPKIMRDEGAEPAHQAAGLGLLDEHRTEEGAQLLESQTTHQLSVVSVGNGPGFLGNGHHQGIGFLT